MAADYPVAGMILEHRQLQKLQSTYVEALPKMVDPQTGRIHTTYNQTIAGTGRLSSVEPNSQNIPIRTALDRPSAVHLFHPTQTMRCYYHVIIRKLNYGLWHISAVMKH